MYSSIVKTTDTLRYPFPRRTRCPSLGSRAAVLRRSEQTRLIVCERRRSKRPPSAIRAPMFAPPICRRSRRNVSRTKPVLPKQSFRRIRRRRRLPSEHRSERSRPSNTASTASEAIKKQSNSAVVDCTLTGNRQFTSFVTRQQTLRSSRNHPDELLQSANGCPS